MDMCDDRWKDRRIGGCVLSFLVIYISLVFSVSLVLNEVRDGDLSSPPRSSIVRSWYYFPSLCLILLP